MLDIDEVDNDADVDTYDQYVGAQVRVPIGGEIRSGKVMRRNHELDGNWKARANTNSMLDSRTYEIEFPDGRSDTPRMSLRITCMHIMTKRETSSTLWTA
jgi:hypothetical protein